MERGSELLGSLSNHDDDHNDDFKKTIRFNDQNNSSTLASRFLFSTFLCRSLHDYDVKTPNLTLYGACYHTTTITFNLFGPE